MLKVFKWFMMIVGSLILTLVLITVWGPWDTYRTQSNDGNMLGTKVYVSDLPVWFGTILKWTSHTTTQKESDEAYLIYLDLKIEQTKQYQIDNPERADSAKFLLEIYQEDRARLVKGMEE